MQLTHRDVNLNYFSRIQSLVSRLICGDNLAVNGSSYLNFGGQPILKFSQKFVETIEERKARGYDLRSAAVNFIVYWQCEKAEQEIKIVLPELHFVRKERV
jgi:ATP-dependent DNA helicase RecQ